MAQKYPKLAQVTHFNFYFFCFFVYQVKAVFIPSISMLFVINSLHLSHLLYTNHFIFLLLSSFTHKLSNVLHRYPQNIPLNRNHKPQSASLFEILKYFRHQIFIEIINFIETSYFVIFDPIPISFKLILFCFFQSSFILTLIAPYYLLKHYQPIL